MRLAVMLILLSLACAPLAALAEEGAPDDGSKATAITPTSSSRSTPLNEVMGAEEEVAIMALVKASFGLCTGCGAASYSFALKEALEGQPPSRVSLGGQCYFTPEDWGLDNTTLNAESASRVSGGCTETLTFEGERLYLVGLATRETGAAERGSQVVWVSPVASVEAGRALYRSRPAKP